MSSSRKTLLVTGATGKQGGALIDALLAAPDAGGFNIVAVTRDATSPRAQKLAAHFNVSVVAGDVADADALFASIPAAARPVWGLYSVQVNSDAEEAQGRALVDAAAAHGVRHIVYSSGDRGGPAKSPTNPTTVKNFAAKFHIEKHLEAVVAAANNAAADPPKLAMTYTILRPVSFFENLTNDVHGRGFARMWEQMSSGSGSGSGNGNAKKLQLVATRDIGWFAAQAFMRPEDYANTALTLVGDELTQPEADVLFRQIVGTPMPLAPCPIASAVKFFLKGTVGDMFRWFEQEGYGGDVAECRRRHPEMRDFKAWLDENKGQWAKR
ncbi:NAD(P)-binding domain protein [Niveomyces insectorum RCEF 264]|uniref:NAD(P)-binding domain protein n=1 Tax=Niveomyces insectorum RCEF 264 TaxID=1081102 RepID=A0A162J8L0_9HYPO|nr:NAD(P)-binding domain protein [Niveomyces insectorum RCEF 264]